MTFHACHAAPLLALAVSRVPAATQAAAAEADPGDIGAVSAGRRARF